MRSLEFAAPVRRVRTKFGSTRPSLVQLRSGLPSCWSNLGHAWCWPNSAGRPRFDRCGSELDRLRSETERIKVDLVASAPTWSDVEQIRPAIDLIGAGCEGGF